MTNSHPPKLTDSEWRWLQSVVGRIASEHEDHEAESIRTKLYHSMGLPPVGDAEERKGLEAMRP